MLTEEQKQNYIDIFLSKGKNRTKYCKCGSVKKFMAVKNKQDLTLSSTCGKKECHPRFGILRPNHSKIMKEKANSGIKNKFTSNLIKHGELLNPEINSINFKRKKLSNQGYNIINMTDDEIVALNSTYESKKQFEPTTISRTISNFIIKHSLLPEFDNHNFETLMVLPYNELLEYRYKYYAWHHVIYCSEVCGAKRFKRTLKANLHYNMRKLDSVLIRSTYESSYIDFFEKNKIFWDYESFRINLYRGFYTPDILFKYNNTMYILEIKGYLLEKDKYDYMTRKINGAYNYAKERGWEMIFTFDPRPKNINDLIQQKMKGKF